MGLGPMELGSAIALALIVGLVVLWTGGAFRRDPPPPPIPYLLEARDEHVLWTDRSRGEGDVAWDLTYRGDQNTQAVTVVMRHPEPLHPRDAAIAAAAVLLRSVGATKGGRITVDSGGHRMEKSVPTLRPGSHVEPWQPPPRRLVVEPEPDATEEE